MTAPEAPTSAPGPGRARKLPGPLVVLVAVPLLVSFALWAFAWPAARTAPRDLPLGVAGPAAATAPVEARLEQHPDAFALHRYADEAAAREAIRDRDVYGALVATPRGPKLLTASAAGPAVAQLLTQAAAEAAPDGTRLRTEDVVPPPPGDPRGSALSASVLPLALAGVATGALVTLMRLRGTRGMLALLAAAALVGLAATALTDSWLGVLAGDWWAEVGAFGLTVLAVSSAVAGLGALLGLKGIGAGAMLSVLLGNPWSGVPSAPELLPAPVGTLGQWLPPGAGGTLLRGVGFFDGRAVDTPVLVLTVWSVLGLTALALGGLRGARQRAAAPLSAGRDTPSVMRS
ncbi:ABC transporter permease [Streptomyces tubbatahanensis]|uniref:ABC transporter permease n=1 Tax=Streptomyces tubbatahanensis TaxID=2923272 RepID=A0ABY3XMM1_9ACTN|nr:ABC transporter permease [Streptomyces tubbatahanensis]UNS95658.1 ABC transporter permease [Streptomyces tubbatahanensis]